MFWRKCIYFSLLSFSMSTNMHWQRRRIWGQVSGRSRSHQLYICYAELQATRLSQEANVTLSCVFLSSRHKQLRRNFHRGSHGIRLQGQICLSPRTGNQPGRNWAIQRYVRVRSREYWEGILWACLNPCLTLSLQKVLFYQTRMERTHTWCG